MAKKSCVTTKPLLFQKSIEATLKGGEVNATPTGNQTLETPGVLCDILCEKNNRFLLQNEAKGYTWADEWTFCIVNKTACASISRFPVTIHQDTTRPRTYPSVVPVKTVPKSPVMARITIPGDAVAIE